MEVKERTLVQEVMGASREISRNFLDALHGGFAAVFYGWNLDGIAVWRSSWTGNSLRGKVVGRHPFTGKITLRELRFHSDRQGGEWEHQVPAREVHRK